MRRKLLNLKTAEMIGLYLYIANYLVIESRVTITNNLSITNKNVKKVERIQDDIEKLRSSLDDDLIDIMNNKDYNSLSNHELNSLFYPSHEELLANIIGVIETWKNKKLNCI